MASKISVEVDGEVRSVRDITSKGKGDPFLSVMVLGEDADEAVEVFGPEDKWTERPQRGDQVVVAVSISIREQEGYKPQLSVWCDEVRSHTVAAKA